MTDDARAGRRLFLGLLLAVAVARGAELPRGDWAAHGFAAVDRQALADWLDAGVARGQTAGGNVLLLHRGEVISEHAFGEADREAHRPFEMTTPCVIASLSKGIIATLAMRLVEAGKLDLDAPVDRYLPDFYDLRLRSGAAPGRLPTVRELLCHTAGFTPDTAEHGRPWLRREAGGKTLAEMVARYPTWPVPGLVAEPGTRFGYSGIHYDIAGRILEIVSGQPLDALLQEQLCRPLGMTGTLYNPAPAYLARGARHYSISTKTGRLFLTPRRPPPGPAEGGSMPYVSVGGSIWSTASDLARFLLFHRSGGLVDGERLLPAERLREMYDRRPPRSSYGLGWILGPPRADGGVKWIYHTGSSGTLHWVDWEHDVVGVILTQTSGEDGRPPSEGGPVGFSRQAKARIDRIFGWAGQRGER
ncbi:MAG: beta-lactamase family protein [Armatimonadetes bacterium]|nr:beta-lactamase family protein [Armatimonadota bacterium]